MGSLIAPFDEKGILQTKTTSGDSLTNKSGKNKNTVDSDMFLTLLVAEMQNQDPLEPTSNTEWVSQYATFTQVQKMSEMAEAIDVLRANELIGKEVIMKTTSESTGEVTYTQGIVDFIEVENGKPLLVIDDKKYSIADLDTVVSSEYSKAYEKYSTFKEMIDALPDISYADKTYENVIQGAFDFYNTMDDYQKNYMKIYGSEQMEKFTEWKLELENMGVKFKDSSVEEEEKKTSLDDILESFNTKMNAIIDKLNLLSENKTTEENNTKKPEDVEKKPEDTTDKTNNSTTGQTGETTGNQSAGGNVNESGENTGNANESNGTVNGAENSSNQTDTGTENSDNQTNTGTVDGTENSDNQTNAGTVDGTESSDNQANTGTVSGTENSDNQTNAGTEDAGNQTGTVNGTENSENQVSEEIASESAAAESQSKEEAAEQTGETEPV